MGRKHNKATWAAAIICLLAICAFVAQPLIGAFEENKENDVNEEDMANANVPEFSEDSAYVFCQKQCEYGPRVMNSEAHKKCGEWIIQKFKDYGCNVEEQKADLKAWDGTMLKSTNILARLNPGAQNRILICAHWDSRPWADNDPDETNHKKPVMAANDGASGIAVMLEIARTLNLLNPGTLNYGVDFVCFDAEDYGTDEAGDESWALGAQYWAKQYAQNSNGLTYQYGILLDMVGGENAKFYEEGMSLKYAPQIVSKIWAAAENAGYGSFFPQTEGGYITDDHIPVNKDAGIPCVDIIPYYPDCQQSTFGYTWHTVSDTMEHISKATLKAVGQTLLWLIING